jgi:hypothetical protein
MCFPAIKQSITRTIQNSSKLSDASFSASSSAALPSVEAPAEEPSDPPEKRTQNRPTYLRSLHPHVNLFVSPISGRGLICVAPIKEGEVIWNGDLAPKDAFQTETVENMLKWPRDKLDDFLHFSFQIDDHLFEGCFTDHCFDDAFNFTNHSCDPNTWFAEGLHHIIVARRDIAPGDEITFDYAMCESYEWNFDILEECMCGSGPGICRGHIRCDDWSRADVRNKYRGHFMPYLNRKIENYEQSLAKQAPSMSKDKAVE